MKPWLESLLKPDTAEKVERGKAWLGGLLKTEAEKAERRIAWLEGLLKPETGERSERRTVDKFAAYRWSGSDLKQERVRNISQTGVYVLTEERLPLETLLFLTMQREGPLETDPEHRIETRARVARHGQDGVGLSFVWADDPESSQWEGLRRSLLEQLKPKDMQGFVRIAEAITFLSRICPGKAQIVGQLVLERLSNHKLANAIEIVLRAESLLESVHDGLRADSGVVVRILEDGSGTEEDWLRHLWAGLLSTSCGVGGKDQLNPAFIGLFSQLTTFPVRILTVVCTRATKVLEESGSISAEPLACNIEELTITTKSRGVQTERDLERLSELGLIEKGDSNSLTLLASDEVYITPTGLGLELLARCNGHRGPLRNFYPTASPDTLPQPNR
jgi:hypothetical protein